MDMSALYSVLAQGLLTICPGSFSSAVIDAELKDDWSNTVYRCETASGWSKGLPVQASVDFKVDDALHAIRKQMTIPGQTPWSRCTFTLFPDGKFKFDVEYDD